MYRIFKDFTFAAGHSIRGHTGGCENLHGHNYRVRIHVRSERLDDLGMVLDFAELKSIAAQILEPFDHRVINDIPPFDEVNTTAELFSEYVFRRVEEHLEGRGDDRGVEVERVEVWENDTSCAVFGP